MYPSRLLRRLVPVLALAALLLMKLAACGVQKEELNDCCMAAPVSQSTIT
ncbi:MAG: hypothetical protein ACLUNZ_08570 [Evtepia sp.]